MKELYESTQIEIVVFETEDIVTDSGNSTPDIDF